jgi:ribulose-phosphate 3-epimerase
MVRISASILGFFFEAKAKKFSDNVMISNINKALQDKKDQFQILHLDIEDGKFVEYKSFTPSQIRKIKIPCKAEAHLMVVDYKKYIKDYFQCADMFIIHNEVLKSNFRKTIDFLKKNKKFVGISINPETSVDEIKYLDKIDLVLVMSIHPGLPGQKFIDYNLRKIRKLRDLRKRNKYHYMIEVDGGIDPIIAKKCSEAGADILVMGSKLFRQ